MARPTVSIHFVNDALAVAAENGLNANAVLQWSGVMPALLESARSRIPQAQFSALIRKLQWLTRDELWGLCPHALPLGSFAMMCRLLTTYDTLGEALRAGAQFYHVITPDFTVRLAREQGLAVLRLSDRLTSPERRRIVHSTVLFFLHGLASWLIDRRLPLVGVDFCFLPSIKSAEFRPLFQAPVRYQRSTTKLFFETSWLSEPVAQDLQSVQRYLRLAPGVLTVGYRDEKSFSEKVRRRLRQQLGHTPALKSVADALHLSPLALRRRLQIEGQSFHQIKDEVRRDAAINLLRHSSISAEDIAERLGFAEPSTFHRAFRRWTGLAPGEYRRQRSSNPE